MEIFTGRRPTDEMFKDGLNLHNFVRANLPRRVMQVVDHVLTGAGELEQQRLWRRMTLMKQRSKKTI